MAEVMCQFPGSDLRHKLFALSLGILALRTESPGYGEAQATCGATHIGGHGQHQLSRWGSHFASGYCSPNFASLSDTAGTEMSCPHETLTRVQIHIQNR